MGLGDIYSHYPILAAAVARTQGPVLELGSGDGSTFMLHYMCKDRYLLTADSDLAWLRRYSAYMCPRKHELQHVDDWAKWDMIEAVGQWAVAFVDCAPGEARTPLIRRLKGRARFIVVHDSERDYGTGANYKYEEVIPLFRYVSEWRRVRPYTLVLSDDEPFEIDGCDRIWDPKSA